jgi:hypothetical protein
MGCSDSRWSIPTATSLLDQHNFDLDEYAPLVKARGLGFTERVANHSYTIYPFGASILAAPAVAVLRPLAAIVSTHLPSLWTSLVEAQRARGCPPAQGEPVIALNSWTEQIIASAIVGLSALLLYAIASEELSLINAAVIALIFAFGTSAWSTASRSLWQHGPSMLMLAAALYFQLRGRSLIVVGMALAFSYVVRPTNSIPLAITSLWVAWNQPRRAGLYLTGVALVLMPFFWINREIYGAWLSPYYHPAYHRGNPFFVEALVGGLFSPGRGLFVYSPVLAFAAAGIVLKIRQHRFTSLDASLIACVFLYWIATAWVNPIWWGGDSYGPRLTGDVVPYLIYWTIPVVAWLRSSAGSFRPVVVATFAAAAIVSALMHAQGVFNRNALTWNWEPATLDKDVSRLWDWRHPPFLAGFVTPPAAERLPDLRTIPCEAPAPPPTNFLIRSHHGSTVSLVWNPSTEPVGFYIVEAGSASGLSDLSPRETPATSLTITRIPPGTYYARVRATNACGVSAPSNEITVVIEASWFS